MTDIADFDAAWLEYNGWDANTDFIDGGDDHYYVSDDDYSDDGDNKNDDIHTPAPPQPSLTPAPPQPSLTPAFEKDSQNRYKPNEQYVAWLKALAQSRD